MTTVKMADKAYRLLADGIRGLNLNLSDSQIDGCYEHLRRLERWNKTHNLTAITTLQDMVIRHTLDALSVLPWFASAQQVLDVGTGAGFPGIPLAIAKPEISVSVLDANHKKTSFVRTTAVALGLQNCEIYTSRVESFQPSTQLDTITMRAFSDPQRAMSWVGHLLQPSGKLVLMLGQKLDENQFSHDLFELDSISSIQVPNLAAQRHVALVIRR